MMETDSSIAAMLIIAPNYQLYHGVYSEAISGYPLKIHTFCNFLACISLWTSIPRIL